MKAIATFLAVLFTLTFATAVSAADYVCKGDRVEKSGSTKYKVRHSGSDICVEKSGSTKGCAKKSGSKYRVEVSGSTKATFDSSKIYKSGSTWASISDAKNMFDCKDPVAATLYVLKKMGYLD